MITTVHWPVRIAAALASLVLVASVDLFTAGSIAAAFVVVAGLASFQSLGLAVDLAGATVDLPKFRADDRTALAWVSAGVLVLVPGAFALLRFGPIVPWWAYLLVAAGTVAGFVGSGLVISKLRNWLALDLWALVVASIEVVALHLMAHIGEATLGTMTKATLVLCVGAYSATLLGSFLLALLGAARIGVLRGVLLEPKRRAVVIVAALGVAVALLVAHASFFVGRYQWFHVWLLVGGILSLETALTVGLAPLRESTGLRRVGLAAGFIQVTLVAAFFVAPLAAAPSVRSKVESAELARPVLMLREAELKSFDLKDHRLLDYDKLHDYDAPENDYNILLITIDTLRYDYVGSDAEYAKAAPRLNALASESSEFARAYAPSSHTAASMGSFLNGRYSANLNWRLWIRHNRRLHHPEKISDSKREAIGDRHRYTTVPDTPANGNLAQRLKQAGYATMATPYLAHAPFFRKGVGYEKGFDVYKDYQARVKKVPSSQAIVRDALAQIDSAKGTQWYQWTHLFDPHEGRARHDRYSEVVRHTDDAVGELLDGLVERGLWEKTIIVVTSDHGEQMGEHGQNFHGLSLYDEEARTPLIIRVPGTKPRILTEPVSTLDAAATLVSLADGELAGMDGVNLAPFIYEGRYPEDRPVFIELHRYKKRATSPNYDVKGVVLGNHKLLYDRKSGKTELFDLAADPGEQENLAEARGELANDLAALVHAFVGRAEETYRLPGTVNVTGAETGDD